MPRSRMPRAIPARNSITPILEPRASNPSALSAAIAAIVGGLEAERLVDLVAERVAERVAASFAAAHGTEYTSAGPLPPGISRARFCRVVKQIPGAKKDGKILSVAKSAWDAHRARPVVVAAQASPVDVEADELLAGAGLRASLRIVGGTR